MPQREKLSSWIRQAAYTAVYLVLELLTGLLAPTLYLAWTFKWLDARAQRRLLGREVEIPKARDGVRFTLTL